jgi:Protein of unknown function (DUF992)
MGSEEPMFLTFGFRMSWTASEQLPTTADIGYLSSGVMIWSVLAPTNNLGQGALAGHYAGATASAAVGIGGGATS